MTDEQKQALDRVKATWAHAHENDAIGSFHQTNDTGVLLGLLETLEQKVESIKDDVEEVKAFLQENGSDSQTAIELLNSSLYFLNDLDLTEK